MRRSLSTTVLVTTAATLVAGTLAIFGLWVLLGHFEPNWVRDRDLASTADHVIDALELNDSGTPIAVSLPKSLQQVMNTLPADFFYQIIDDRGAVLLTSNGDARPVLPEHRRPVESAKPFALSREGLPMRSIVVPVKRANSKVFVLVARSDRFDETLIDNELGNIAHTILVGLIATMVTFSAIILLTFKRALKPLTDASAAAARIDSVNLRARLNVQGVPLEVVPLIESFNQALERLETGFRIQQEFLATAAHELKTPLALIRGEIELDGPTNRRAILADLDHMSRHVHQLLHLAEVSDANNLNISQIDALPIVQDAINFIERLANSKRVMVEISHSAPPVTVHADASALFVLVRNLVENAVNHSPPNSFVCVVLEASGLAVIDQGSGIPEADMPKLFKRFWRGAHRRDEGAGLGLSICSEIVRGHGWAISASNIAPAGARFEVQFTTPN